MLKHRWSPVHDDNRYYATGCQKVFAIARAAHPGSESLMELAEGEERWPYILHVQVRLAVPTIALTPSWKVLEIPSTSISQKPYVETSATTYTKAWDAIVDRTRPA